VNPVADHLVERVSDWPGASSFGMHHSGRTKTVARPRGFFRTNGNMPDEVTLRIERPEGFEELTEEEWVAKLGEAVRREEKSAREERMASGRGVLGRKAVLRAVPTDSPKTIELRRGLRPHVACRDKARRIAVLTALAEFRARRRAALVRWLNGECDVVFPLGTYRVRALVLAAPPRLALAG
jgi:hypothetical protein